MNARFSDPSIGAIAELLKDYFDGLYEGDLAAFGRIFHPKAHLYASDGATVTELTRDAYFAMIEARQSPKAQGLKRYDRILSIHKAGPNTALATVNCAMPPRYFTDYLTLLCTDEGWQIISKTYHTEIHE